ncbi:MAG: hypothetical protein KGY45_02115 [Hadesarchaea archaeon]|nr:hypothetical protein [Hadesarchaea archaeon]
MEILTTNTGSYPRVGDKPGQQKLREKYNEWETNEITDEELEEVYKETTENVIKEQVESGLDIVTDGQLRWYDPLSHFARKISGCKVNGLLRFFDTNFYFRQPVIESEISWSEPMIKKEYLSARESSSVPVKPVLTGPYTMAKNSINKNYSDFNNLVMDFAEIISKEVKELSESGAEIIQIDEPTILKNPEDTQILHDAVSELSQEKREFELALYVYFGNSTPLYEELTRLPIDTLGLDFTYSPDLPEKIGEIGCEKNLGLGLIDGRNTKREKNREVLEKLREIIPNIESERVYLNPSCGLDFLPREKAVEKLEHMVEIANEAREEFE